MVQCWRASSSDQYSAVYLHLKDNGHSFEDSKVFILIGQTTQMSIWNLGSQTVKRASLWEHRTVEEEVSRRRHEMNCAIRVNRSPSPSHISVDLKLPEDITISDTLRNNRKKMLFITPELARDHHIFKLSSVSK